MNSEQFALIAKLLERIADRPFTITQATDWQMLYVMLGMVASGLLMAVGFFWRDVTCKFRDMSAALKEFKVDDCKAHETLKDDFSKANDTIWTAIKDCQSDCCPPQTEERRWMKLGANDTKHPAGKSLNRSNISHAPDRSVVTPLSDMPIEIRPTTARFGHVRIRLEHYCHVNLFLLREGGY